MSKTVSKRTVPPRPPTMISQLPNYFRSYMLATQVDVSKMEAATGIPFSTLYAFRRGSIKEIRLDYLDKIAAYLFQITRSNS